MVDVIVVVNSAGCLSFYEKETFLNWVFDDIIFLQIENYTIDELCCKLPIKEFSVDMGGERKYDGTAWIQFRKVPFF